MRMRRGWDAGGATVDPGGPRRTLLRQRAYGISAPAKAPFICCGAAFWRCCRSSVVEHSLGKGEVVCSIHTGSTTKPQEIWAFSHPRDCSVTPQNAEQRTNAQLAKHKLSTRVPAVRDLLSLHRRSDGRRQRRRHRIPETKRAPSSRGRRPNSWFCCICVP